MAKDKAEGSAISSESIDLLEQAKKGKPRKFAMICKGTNVVSLVVFKKGSYEKRKKEAKESGKGQFYFGVINGQGMDMQFTMARADGFESEPVKSTVLKSFLAESADFKCKPTFVIVDQLETVLDEDDPLVQRFIALRDQVPNAPVEPEVKQNLTQLCIEISRHFDLEEADAASAKIDQLRTQLSTSSSIPQPPPPPPPPPASSTGGDAVKKLEDALSKLKPMLEQAIAIQPPRKAELLGAVKQVKDFLQNGQTDQAQAAIVQLVKDLKAIVASGAATSEPSTTDPNRTAYEQLLPSIEELVAGAGLKVPDKLPTLQKVLQIAKGQAAKGEFAAAFAGLEKLRTALAGMTASSDSNESTLAQQYESRMGTLEPQLLAVLSQMTGDTSKLRAVSEFAREKAAAGDFASALKALDRLEPMVAQASATDAPKETDVIATGIVALMISRLEAAKRSWDNAVAKGDEEVAKLQNSLKDDDPDLAQALQVTMNTYRGRFDVLAAQASKVKNDNDVRAARAKTIEALYILESEIEDDELLAQLAQHETVSVDIANPLLQALMQVEESLPA